MKTGLFSKGITPIREFWFILGLLILVVTVPTLCLLWFMTQAVNNERLVIRQKLFETYQSQLSAVEPFIRDYWNKKRELLSINSADLSPGNRFIELAKRGASDSAIIFGSDGRLMYPILVNMFFNKLELTSQWKKAQKQ